MIVLEQEKKQFGSIATIKVIGVGGAGGNMLNSIIKLGCEGFECIVANTDAQALERSKAEKKIQIGVKSTKGLGTGSNPEIGERAAEEDLDKVLDAIGDADIVFIAAGMGGGTGSGAAPVVARALREKGILTIAVVTKPFSFEGKRRGSVAERALDQLRKEVDTLIVIPNQKLLGAVDHKVSMDDAFDMINDVLGQSVRGISDIITKPGYINVDFADVRTIMRDKGMAVMGTGKAAGPDRAQKATENAVSSPLLENISIKGAHGVLLNITGGKNLGLHEISKAASIIYEQAHEDANIIIGSVIDENLEDEVIVTIIATGCVQKDIQNTVKVQPTVQHAAPVQDSLKKEQAEKKQEVVLKPAELHVQSEVHQETTTQESEQHGGLSQTKEINFNDLDVPTFLRRQARQQDGNN